MKKLILTLLLLIPSLSWGDIVGKIIEKSDGDYCYDCSWSNYVSVQEMIIKKNQPYPKFLKGKYIYKQKPNEWFPIPFTVKGNYLEYHRVNVHPKGSILIYEDNEYVLQSEMDNTEITEMIEKINQTNKNKANIQENISTCKELGFKKGTEGLKNCVLELS